MSKESFADNSLLEMFGLTYEQSRLMFSVQKMITEYDISLTKNDRQRTQKREWLYLWEKGITAYLNSIDGPKKQGCLVSSNEINNAFRKELMKSPNRTWYYILALEAIEFTPYTPLGTDEDKQYGKLKMAEDKCNSYTRGLLISHGVLSSEKLDRLDKVYSKSLNAISGRKGRIFTRVLAVVALAALTASVATFAAPGIAVAIFGSSFEGLYGIALTNACLALAGGGAVAAGGAGIAGGTAVIAGGGALLGLAGGGTLVGIESLLLESPEYTLTQAAKLETILKEVVLNAQQDVVTAQKIISNYQEQIRQLNDELVRMKLQNEKNKKDLNNISKSLSHLEKAYRDMVAFASAYETGLTTQGGK